MTPEEQREVQALADKFNELAARYVKARQEFRDLSEEYASRMKAVLGEASDEH